MGRYFGREPRYSREELERQAQEAIDARISMGRPPEEDFQPIKQRLAEMELAEQAPPVAQPMPDSEPLRIHSVRPPTVTPEPEAAPERQPVSAARPSSN